MDTWLHQIPPDRYQPCEVDIQDGHEYENMHNLTSSQYIKLASSHLASRPNLIIELCPMPSSIITSDSITQSLHPSSLLLFLEQGFVSLQIHIDPLIMDAANVQVVGKQLICLDPISSTFQEGLLPQINDLVYTICQSTMQTGGILSKKVCTRFRLTARKIRAHGSQLLTLYMHRRSRV